MQSNIKIEKKNNIEHTLFPEMLVNYQESRKYAPVDAVSLAVLSSVQRDVKRITLIV